MATTICAVFMESLGIVNSKKDNQVNIIFGMGEIVVILDMISFVR